MINAIKSNSNDTYRYTANLGYSSEKIFNLSTTDDVNIYFYDFVSKCFVACYSYHTVTIRVDVNMTAQVIGDVIAKALSQGSYLFNLACYGRPDTFIMGLVQNLKPIRIYDSIHNMCSSAIYDADRNVVLASDHKTNMPYYPAGGGRATRMICHGDENGVKGFVPGSLLRGFDVRHCYDDVYILEK